MESRPDRLLPALMVVGRDHGPDEGVGKGLRREAQEPENFLRAADLAGCDIPLPIANMGQMLCFGQVRLALPQSNLHTFAFLDFLFISAIGLG